MVKRVGMIEEARNIIENFDFSQPFSPNADFRIIVKCSHPSKKKEKTKSFSLWNNTKIDSEMLIKIIDVICNIDKYKFFENYINIDDHKEDVCSHYIVIREANNNKNKCVSVYLDGLTNVDIIEVMKRHLLNKKIKQWGV